MSEPRLCKNCACGQLVIKPPEPEKVMPPGLTARQQVEWDRTQQVRRELKPQRVCRLHPPMVTTLPNNHQGLMQQPTTDESVCWQWRPINMLPGEGLHCNLDDLIQIRKAAGEPVSMAEHIGLD